MKENIDNVYVKSIASLITDRQHPYKSYSKLLNSLYCIDFTYSIHLDGNRYEDGVGMRYSFGWNNNIPEAVIASYLDVRPCSVLEMMAALALRCENEIMCDPEKGDRTGMWFWGMMRSLGLEHMKNDIFDENQVKKAVNKMLERNYCFDGKGGLFTVKDPPCDMRTTEIWYQAMWYLNRYKEE
ncbi:MAG: hypothetical protein NC120_12295 [Ruminococcus sp.]|nr:hypothetical protein [Ruminococcus sp.]